MTQRHQERDLASRLSNIGKALVVTITFAFKSSVFAAATPKIDGPNTDLNFGTKITQEEINTYNGWYNDIKESQNIYTIESGKWADNRTGKWAWSGSYLMCELLNMYRMTYRACNDANDPTVVGYLEQFTNHSRLVY